MLLEGIASILLLLYEAVPHTISEDPEVQQVYTCSLSIIVSRFYQGFKIDTIWCDDLCIKLHEVHSLVETPDDKNVLQEWHAYIRTIVSFHVLETPSEKNYETLPAHIGSLLETR